MIGLPGEVLAARSRQQAATPRLPWRVASSPSMRASAQLVDREQPAAYNERARALHLVQSPIQATQMAHTSAGTTTPSSSSSATGRSTTINSAHGSSNSSSNGNGGGGDFNTNFGEAVVVLREDLP